MAARLVGFARAHAFSLALGALCLALLGWIVMLRQANSRLASDLRAGRPGSRRSAALPRAPTGDGPDTLKAENQRLRRELQEATAAQVNLPTLSLAPAGQPPATLPADSGALLLLHPPAAGAPAHYRLRILAYDGGMVWEGDGLQRSGDGAITVVWPAALAPPGDYRLELFGPAPTDRRVETYHLKVHP